MTEDITPATDEQIAAWGEAADAWASKYDGCDEPPPVTEFGYGVVQKLIARVRQAESKLAWAAQIFRDAEDDGGYLDGKEARHWLAAYGAGEDA